MSIINEALKKAGKGEGHLDSSLKVTAQAPREVPVPLLMQPAGGRDSAKPFLHRFGYWAGGAVLVAGILWLYRPNLDTNPSRVIPPDGFRSHELVQVSMAPAAAPPQAGMKPETQVFTNTFDTMPIPDDP
ncbi:MAG: hypothetical protein HYY14_00645, partial [Candidatus Omnitrophica bacterium]|nr:hypothetical protein [Candidatus Omnitrophota bacterium]